MPKEKIDEKNKKKEEKKKPAGLRMTSRGEVITEKEHKEEMKQRQEDPGRWREQL